MPMELNPNTPRQRIRRTERAAQEQPSQMAAPAQPVPVVQRVQMDYQQAPQALPQQAPVSRAVPPPQAGPVRPMGYVQPQHLDQNGYLRQPQAPAPVQPAMQPRVLNQHRVVNSGWQQPTLPAADRPRAESVPPRGKKRSAPVSPSPWAEESPAPKKNKVPGWLTTALALSIVLVMALAAAYWLMQAYLTTQENQRIAAYQAVLDNYHLTEQADGTLQVTWQTYIEKYATQYNLQPAFVTAIIRNESSFRTNAESSVGARGLMQMMPETAEWIAGKLDDDSYTFDNMYDAETNIRYGCWYLGYLSKLFRGDAELVSAAYHAGQTTVTQWLSDPEKSSDGVTLDLDKLSDGPTKQYIGRVTQAYGIYQTLLYPDEAFGAADDVSAGGHDAAAPDR